MPETATQQTQVAETSTSTQVGTASSEPELSAYDKIYREYFGNLLGDETVVSTSSTNSTPDYSQNFNVLTNEIKALKGQLASMGQNPPRTVSQEAKDTFLDLYAKGDKEGARKALLAELGPQIRDEIRNGLVRDVSENTIRATRAENEIRSYGQQLRDQNPDLISFERAISLEAKDLVEQAVNNGYVKNVDEYVAASKNALKISVDNYRKRVLELKGSAKVESQTRTTEVSKMGVIPPNGTSRVVPTNGAQTPPDISADSYLARRRTAWEAGKGYPTQ